MSTPPSHTAHSRIPPVPVRERAACMCVQGDACSTFAPGHALHLIQTRLVSATPSEWVDAIVESVAPDGAVALRTIVDGRSLAVWNGAGISTAVTAGTPVALHERYHVLSVGARWFNVAAV